MYFRLFLILLFVVFFAVLIVTSQDICSIAKIRLSEVHYDWSHSKFKNQDYFYKYCLFCYEFGENLAKGQISKDQAIKDWYNSPSHRINLEKRWRYSCLESDNFNGENYYVFIFAN